MARAPNLTKNVSKSAQKMSRFDHKSVALLTFEVLLCEICHTFQIEWTIATPEKCPRSSESQTAMSSNNQLIKRTISPRNERLNVPLCAEFRQALGILA